MAQTRLSGSRLLAAVCLLLTGLSAAHNASAFYNSTSAMGTNTNEIMEDDASAPFIDLMKMALPFREARPLTKGEIQYDQYGWPRSISPGGQAGTRILNKLPAGTIPRGYYSVLYEGEGKLEYGNDASLVEHTPGKDVIMIDPGRDNQLSATFYIKATNPANYIRNVRILPQGGICASNPFQRVANASQCGGGEYLSFEQHSSKIIFNPDYLRYMRDFRVIRFMNMSGITRNPVYAWEDRASIDQATWGGAEGIRGAPMEVMVELANRLHADPWFSLPHAATDDFIRRFAEYVRVHVDPSLKVYVEYTNEAWNGIFNQHRYMLQQGQRLGLDSDPERASWKYYSRRSVEIFNIWEQAFGGKERLVRVLAGFIGNKDMSKTILAYNGAYRYADAFAIAPYVYGDYNALRHARNVGDIFSIMNDPRYAHSLPNELNAVQQQAEIAKSFGVDLIAYEGGQHLVDSQSKSNDQYPNNLFYQANRSPQMGVIYQRLLQGWKQAGGKLFVHYTTPRIYQKYGSFGAKEYITQPDSQAPKQNAILGFSRSNPCWWAGCSGNALVRHTKPAITLEAMKAQSEPLDASAPQHASAYNEAPPAPAGNNRPATSIASVNPAAVPPPPRILVSLRGSGEQYVMGNNAIIRPARSGNVWQGASSYQLRNVAAGRIDGSRDLAALWQASWDQRNLYLRVGVEDDTFRKDSATPWEDDAIEIYIDGDGSFNSQYDGRNDFHFIFDGGSDKVAVGRNTPPLNSIPMNHRMIRVNGGYILEVTLPWQALRVQPRPGMRFGLDVHVDDDDDGNGRDGKLAWRASTDDAWRNPSLMGRVILGE
jgi:hypothetical protein